MAFNLKKVLRALIFSTSQPLSVKDFQAAFTRYHEQAALPAHEGEEGSEDALSTAPLAPPEIAAAAQAAMPLVNAPGDHPDASSFCAEDSELYSEVPSLVTATQIRETLTEITEELRLADLGLQLVEGNQGYQLMTEPRFARWVRVLRNEPPPVKLSQSSLETLAVVAYRQPVTRSEIEHIRGVSAEAGVSKLRERELIYIVGRADLPGRPLQFGTTEKFLEFVGVKSIDELPASDVLSSRQIDEWLQTTTNAKTPSDVDMGLPLELGEGSSPTFEQVSVSHEDSVPAASRSEDTSAPSSLPATTPAS